ncbi:MAG: right-handed parallel beta-helix repeat-containing protein [Pirellulales bacterium]
MTCITQFKFLFLCCVLCYSTNAAAQEIGQPKLGNSQSAKDSPKDDTAELQTAIDAGGGVQLEGRSYFLTKTLVVDLQRTGYFSLRGNGCTKLVMQAAGPAIRIAGTHTGTADPKSVKSEVWDRQRAPTIEGIEIVGTQAEACGIELEETMQAILSKLVIRQVRHAMRLSKRNRNIIISDCQIYENRGCGILLDEVDLHQINIANCHISYNCGGGIVSKGGNVRNLQVTGCDIEANMCPDQPATANVLIDCRTSHYGTAEVAITGCTIQHSNVSGAANVRIFGKGIASEKSDTGYRWGNVTITGNVFSDVETNLHLDGCRGVTVQGNTFWMGYKNNLLVENCSNIVVGPNNLDRNPGYDYGTAKTTANAIIVQDSQDCTIHGLHISQVSCAPAAMVIERCRRMNIGGCTILDCAGVGLLLKDVKDSLVTGCLIQDDQPNRVATPSCKIINGENNQLTANRFAQGQE